MTISTARTLGARVTIPDSLSRIGRYTLVRAITIGIAVVVGILLTIFVANFGGKMDEIKKAAIAERVMMEVMENPELRLLPVEERSALMTEMIAIEERRQGLDRPFLVRTPGYLTTALTLDLGWARTITSPSGSRLVRNIIVERLPATLVLFGTANLLLFFITLFGGLFLSRRYGSALDKANIALAPTSTTPGWFCGIFLIFIFAILLGILPFGGMVEAPPPPTRLGYALSLLEHMVLPVLAILISAVFGGIYGSRTFFLIYSSEDYVEMARAKGLSSGAIERKHILRPTLPPILMGFAFMLIGMWGGSIILEAVFSWPGLGSVALGAITLAETPLIVGTAIIFAYLLAMTLFVMDIVFALVDPRIKIGAERRV